MVAAEPVGVPVVDDGPGPRLHDRQWRGLLASGVLGWLPIGWSAHVGVDVHGLLRPGAARGGGPMAWLISKLVVAAAGNGRTPGPSPDPPPPPAHRPDHRRALHRRLHGHRPGNHHHRQRERREGLVSGRPCRANSSVRAMFPDVATGQATEVPNEVGDQIRQVPGTPASIRCGSSTPAPPVMRSWWSPASSPIRGRCRWNCRRT